MKKVGIICLLSLLVSSFALADRALPPEVEVSYKGVRFVADRFRLGYVDAYNIETNKKVWEKKIYDSGPFDDEIPKMPFACVTSLSIKNGKLLVTNEEDRKYEIVIPKEILSDVSRTPSAVRG